MCSENITTAVFFLLDEQKDAIVTGTDITWERNIGQQYE